MGSYSLMKHTTIFTAQLIGTNVGGYFIIFHTLS